MKSIHLLLWKPVFCSTIVFDADLKRFSWQKQLILVFHANSHYPKYPAHTRSFSVVKVKHIFSSPSRRSSSFTHSRATALLVKQMLPTIPAMIKSSLFATGILERVGSTGEVRLPAAGRMLAHEAHAGRVINVAEQAKALNVAEHAKAMGSSALMLPEVEVSEHAGGTTSRITARKIAEEPLQRWWQLSSISALDILLSAPHI